MKILSVSFIQDYDLVNDTNNKVAFVEDGDPTIRYATISPGNYSIANFPATIGNGLSSAGTQGYTATYDPITRKLTVSTNGAKDFKILEGNRGTTAYLLTGMSRWSETGYGKSFVFKNPVDLSGSHPILITSNINIRGVKYLSDFNESEQLVVTTIIPDSFGDVVTFTNDNGEFLPVDDTISKIEFHLIDSITGQELALNSPLTVRFIMSDDVNDVL
jgi:hypothetical protein